MVDDGKIFSDEVVNCIRENIFPAAHGAIQDWNNFPWHTGPKGNCDSNVKHSSQALIVDVFGTLKTSKGRNAILNALALRMGLPKSEQWEIELEYLDRHNLLRERRLTQVDAVARSKDTLIFFECKFTEGDGGGYRQPLPLLSGANKGKVQCNGRYSMQENPVNQFEAACALTGKKIRYWDYIPEVFKLASIDENKDCPFRYGWYQWMRNLTNCYAQAAESGAKPGFVVVYADHPNLAMAQKAKSAEWQRLVRSVRQDRIAFNTLSYQELLALACENDRGDGEMWTELKKWVCGKIYQTVIK